MESIDRDEREPGAPETGEPVPAARRFRLILASGVVLIALAAVARAALEGAAAPPPGVIEPTDDQASGATRGTATSVARYEYERARAMR